jgi:hypothetical protein
MGSLAALCTVGIQIRLAAAPQSLSRTSTWEVLSLGIDVETTSLASISSTNTRYLALDFHLSVSGCKSLQTFSQ